MSEHDPPQLSADRAMRFHRGFPLYAPTPVVTWQLGTQPVRVKDETARMGLGAFKAIGGTYAVAQLLGEKLGLENLHGGWASRTHDANRTAPSPVSSAPARAITALAVAAGAA
jgi:diaminopropionate ammonia-lyase